MGGLACHGVANRRFERFGTLKPGFRVLGDCFFHHAIPHRGQRRVERRGRHGLLPEHLVHDACHVPDERLLAGKELVQDDTARKKVAAKINRLALKLLWRHVGRRAHHRARQRQLGGFDPCNAKVGDLDPAIGQHDQVGWLHVAVGDALAMGMVQRVKDLAHDASDFFQRKPLVVVKVVFQLAPCDKLHGDESHALTLKRRAVGADDDRVVIFGIHFPVLVNRHDARVVQAARRLRLTLETGQHADQFTALKLRGQDCLDGDRALKYRVEALVNDSHRPPAKLSTYQILTEFGHCRHDDRMVQKRRVGGFFAWRSVRASGEFNRFR